MLPRVAVLACACSLWLTLASSARADAYAAALARAIAAKEQALDNNDPESWQAALRLFFEADALRETKEGKYELAYAAARLRQDDLAVEAYEDALALGLSGAAAAKAREFVANHRGELAEIEVSGPHGVSLHVGTQPRGELPLRRALLVFPGRTTLTARRPDGASVIHNVELEPKGRTRVSVAFPPDELPAAPTGQPPAAPPRTRLPTNPATQGPRPLPPSAPDPGRAQHASVSSLPKQALFWGGTGLAVSSAVVWGFSAVGLDNARQRLDAACPAHEGDRCARTSAGEQRNAQDAVDGIATYKAVRIGAYVGLGTGATLALLGLLIKEQRAPATSAGPSLTVVGAPEAARFVVHGRF
jgi:hypothetical protein